MGGEGEDEEVEETTTRRRRRREEGEEEAPEQQHGAPLRDGRRCCAREADGETRILFALF